MNKIEELKAANAASPGLLKCDADALDSRVFAFMCQAEALMPQLLEAVELLKELRNSLSQYDDGEWYLHDGTEPRLDYIDEVLEKLK